MEFQMSVDLDHHEMANQMAMHDDDQVIEFVKELDVAMMSWPFTEALYKYFKKQHKLYKAEIEEDGK